MSQGINDYMSSEDEDVSSLDKGDVRPGRPAQSQGSVAFIGPWIRIGDGFNEHVRRLALALSRAGEKVHLRGTNYEYLGEQPDAGISEEFTRLAMTDTGSYRASIYAMVYNRDSIRSAMHIPDNCGFPQAVIEHLRRQRIIYTVMETDNLPEGDGRVLSQAGQVWTACRDNAAAIIRAGVPEERVKVIPCPFLPDDPLLALQGRKRKPGVPRFYHIGKWEPRKAQNNIVRAFLLAFRPGQAQLYMRSNPLTQQVAGFPTGPMQCLAEQLKEPDVQAMGWSSSRLEELSEAFKFIDRPLSLQKLVELHEIGDVYVSLSRAEGFDMPGFDAKLAGNRLIHTETAARDYAAPYDIMVPRTGTMAAHSIYKWVGATYGEYDVAAAVRAMRAQADRVREGVAMGVHDMTAWSLKSVGEKMIGHLREVAP